MLGRLGDGERSPLMLIGDRCWSWYLRLPGPRSHPLSGVVRCELPATGTVAAAIARADVVSACLPRFASEAAQGAAGAAEPGADRRAGASAAPPARRPDRAGAGAASGCSRSTRHRVPTEERRARPSHRDARRASSPADAAPAVEVVHRRPTALQTGADDEAGRPAARWCAARGDDRGAVAGLGERQDVAGHEDEVEAALEDSVARSACTHGRSGRRRTARSSMSGSASTPTTSMPRRASSMATRPVPQPASSTDVGASEATKSASPWTSSPAANRASYSSRSTCSRQRRHADDVIW